MLNAVMGQQFFEARFKGQVGGPLHAHVHALLLIRHDLLEGIQENGQTFTLHQELID